MPHCFVTSCNNYYGRTRGNDRIKYHMLPTTAIREAWIQLCGYEKGSRAPSYARVCSAHFSSNCYERDLQHELLGLPLRKKLKKDAVPDQFLPKGTQSLLPHLKSSTISVASRLSNGNSTLLPCENQEKNLETVHNPNKVHNQKSNGTKTRTELTNPKQTNLTINLDEAFKEFQASIENNFMNNNKDVSDNHLMLTNNTSTPKNKTNMNKSKQKVPNHKKNTNVNKHFCIKKKTTIKEKNKAAIKVAVKNKAKKNINTKGKFGGNILKTGRSGVSSDENLVKQTLSLKKNQNDRSRRKTLDGITMSSNKRVQTKSCTKNFKTPDESHSGHSRNTKNELSNSCCSAGPNSVQKTKGKVPIYEKVDKTKNSFASGSGTQNVKTQNLKNKIPIRSSYRIAKKKSIESLSDSFTQKVNRSVENENTWENFTDKLKFMAKLQLRFGKYYQDRVVNNQCMVPTSLKFPKTEEERYACVNCRFPSFPAPDC
ncbi:hypothetical protein WA026_016878 [Henosepilachna vigintioctopunctata]|uniref:THAP-type domain-containing protein n=1 Tax=Henosepilachna vigintioctopunctata TaxID=420089 RepID=A0AAW1U990_9CUCU